MNKVKILFFCCLSLVLFACSSAKDGPPPKALKDFQAYVKVQEVFSKQIKNGLDKEFINLQPIVHEGIIYVSDVDGNVFAINAKGGTLWSKSLNIKNVSSLAVSDNKFFVATLSGLLVAVDLQNGKTLYKKNLQQEFIGNLAVSDNMLFATLGHDTLSAIDTQTGDLLWSYKENSNSLSLRKRVLPKIYGNQVITGFSNGRIVSLDRLTGKIFWKYTIKNPQGKTELDRLVDIRSIELFNESVFAAGFQSKLAKLDVQNGKPLWQKDFSTFNNIAVDIGDIYAIDADSVVYKFSDLTQAEIWRNDDFLRRKLNNFVLIGANLAFTDYNGYIHIINKHDSATVGRLRVASDDVNSMIAVGSNALLVYTKDGKLQLFRII